MSPSILPLRSLKGIFRVTWTSNTMFALLLVDFDVPGDAQAKSHARPLRKSWHSTALRKLWRRMLHSSRKSPRNRYINRPIRAGGTRKLQGIWETLKTRMLDTSLLDWLTLNPHPYHTDRHCSREFHTVQIFHSPLTHYSRKVPPVLHVRGR